MITTYKNRLPFFSVIITSFNRAKLLPRALSSLVNQTEKDWEAIIIDDGSKDGSYDIVKGYCMKYDNIRYLFHSNRGTGLSRNAGILSSCGLFITFLDSDDEYHKEHLSSRKRMLIENSDIEMIYGGCDIIGEPYVPDKYNPGGKIHLDKCVVGGTFVVKRETAIRLGGFPDLRFGDDTEFFAKAMEKGINMRNTDERTYIYHRDSEDSICTGILK